MRYLKGFFLQINTLQHVDYSNIILGLSLNHRSIQIYCTGITNPSIQGQDCITKNRRKMQCHFFYMVHHSSFFQISGDFIYIFSFYSEQHEDRDCYDNISTHLQENQCGVVPIECRAWTKRRPFFIDLIFQD